MIKAYYLSDDRIRLRGLDEKLRGVIVHLWKAAGGLAIQRPLESVDLFEGSPTRFLRFLRTLTRGDATAEIAAAISCRLEGIYKKHWAMPLARNGILKVGEKPLIMGIVNVTPDSFSDGGKYYDVDKAVEHGKKLAAEGADILDIGGESTRPGAKPVAVDEECGRVLPVIERLATEVKIPISIDTRKPAVAERALRAGAALINDATMLTYDPDIARVAADFSCSIIINHILGTPENMQVDPHYDDLWPDIIYALEAAVDKAAIRGVASNAVILDPGIGFGKNLDHNLGIIKGLKALTGCGMPILVGPSRKKFIEAVLHLPPEERLEGTIAACVAALLNGANIFRVHDVLPHRRALDLAWAIREFQG